MYADVANILGQPDLKNEDSFFAEFHFIYHSTMKQDEKNMNVEIPSKPVIVEFHRQINYSCEYKNAIGTRKIQEIAMAASAQLRTYHQEGQ